MIRRRDVPLAAAARGLAIWSGSAFAQTSGTNQNKAATPAPAPVRADDRINQILAPVRDRHHVPGLVGAVIAGDGLAAIGAVGIRKVGAPNSFQVTDQVHIGSCTKAMTATMVGTLVDERKLSFHSTIGQVFSKDASKFHPDFQTVTLTQLLTHHAGLPANGPWWQLSGKNTTEQRRDLLGRVMKAAPQSRPGSKFAYSNTGYALAGLMAEQVTGESWEILLRRRLFEPLGMDSAGFGSPGHPGQIDQPWGHHLSGEEIKPTQQDNAAPLGPAGTVHCTVSDLAKFGLLHLRGAKGEGKLLLKPATFRVLHTPPQGSDYACGWVVAKKPWGGGGRTLWHNGSNTSWYATISIAPARDFSIFVATNQGNAAATTACDEAAAKLIESVAESTHHRANRS